MLILAICKLNINTPYTSVLSLKNDNVCVQKKANEYARLLDRYLIKQDSNILITTLGYIIILPKDNLEIYNEHYENFDINIINN